MILKKKMFTIHRIYSDARGDSHFEDIEVPLQEAGMVGSLSPAIETKEMILREVDPSYDWDFHTAPARQYIILLDGEIEIETSLQERRTFRAGDILLVEDTTGKGHRTRNVKAQQRKSVFITLP
jgi:quercetin dioxygenase-like cupin family protein